MATKGSHGNASPRPRQLSALSLLPFARPTEPEVRLTPISSHRHPWPDPVRPAASRIVGRETWFPSDPEELDSAGRNPGT
jgi:hypothetical protein